MKYVLLAVCGLSPQVITETLYALHQTGRRVDAVHVITTREGKERIFSSLLIPETGPFAKYLHDYEIDPSSIQFTYGNIHVVSNGHGVELSDIVSESDNERLLELCLRWTFRFTRDPDTTVFFSVAGGRKTMSSCLALAVQMYGRPQDRVYHVLVSPEFESNPNFFFPPREEEMIELRDEQGRPMYKSTRYAEIHLAHLPFVSIRDRLSEEYLKEPMDPATLMLSLIREEERHLVVDLCRNKLIYRGVELDLTPARLALYACFIQLKKECRMDHPDCRDCTGCFLDIQQVFEQQQRIGDLYRKLSRGRVQESMSDSGITALSPENFNSYKSKIRRDLIERFGPYAVKDLEISSSGVPPNKRYGVRMDRSRIKVIY